MAPGQVMTLGIPIVRGHSRRASVCSPCNKIVSRASVRNSASAVVECAHWSAGAGGGPDSSRRAALHSARCGASGGATWPQGARAARRAAARVTEVRRRAPAAPAAGLVQLAGLRQGERRVARARVERTLSVTLAGCRARERQAGACARRRARVLVRGPALTRPSRPARCAACLAEPARANTLLGDTWVVSAFAAAARTHV